MKIKVEESRCAQGASRPAVIQDINGRNINVAKLQNDIHRAITQVNIQDDSDDEHVIPDTGSSLAGDFGPREAFLTAKCTARVSSQAVDFGPRQAAPLKIPKSGRAVEGVYEPDPFVAAEKRNLHGAPLMPSGRNSHKYEAYVVFVGWEPGVYQTWAAARSQIFRCPGGFCKGYVTIADARRAYAHSISNGSGGIAIARPPDETNHAPNLTSARSTKTPVSPVLREGTPTPTTRSVKLPNVQSFSRRLSNTDDGGSSLHPLPPPPAPKAHSTHPDHRQSYRRIPSRSDILPSEKYDAADKIVVVFRGKEPGVYFTKKAAMAGIGDVSHPNVYFDFAADRGEAFEMYGVADMEGQLVWLT